jgi:hypothetical protein
VAPAQEQTTFGDAVVHRQDNEHVRPLFAALLLSLQPTVSADSCSNLSGQNLTGQLPDTIARLRLLSSMRVRRIVLGDTRRAQAPLSS